MQPAVIARSCPSVNRLYAPGLWPTNFKTSCKRWRKMVFCWGAITEGYHHLAMSESFLRHASLSRLRFRHLELVRTLAHTGSLHKTARRLSLSQPAVSKAIREIESITGVELFAR